MKNILIICIVLFLSSCATLSYKEPTQGSRSQVRFVTTSDSVTILKVYEEPNCSGNETEWMRLLNGYTLNSSPKSLNMPLWDYHKNAAKEIYVVANKQVNGMFYGGEVIGGKIFSCGTPFTFTFKENMKYEVKYVWDPHHCTVIIYNIVKNGDSWSLVELSKFDNRVNETNRQCWEKFKKKRLY